MSQEIKLTHTGAAAVNPTVHWLPITAENKPPIGARMLLIRRSAGVAQVTTFRDDGWYTHFAGLPTFKD